MHSQFENNNQKLLACLKVLNNLKSLPDQLLGYLIAQSDPLPIPVPEGVILFRQGEWVQGWYLLLSGEVQLYIDQSTSKTENKFIEQQITIIHPGTLFGVLQSSQRHNCSAKILKNAEFVKIPQSNFLSIYNKWADRLHSCIIPIEDLNYINNLNNNNQKKQQRQLPKSPNEKRKKIKKREKEDFKKYYNENNLNKNKEEENIEKGFLLEIKDILKYNNNKQLLYSVEIIANEMSASNTQQLTGSEFCDKLLNLWIYCFGIKPLNSLILTGIGQLLLDNSLLVISTNNIDHNSQFCDYLTYFWSLLPFNNNKLKYSNNKKDILINSLIFLSNNGLNSLLQFILQKPKEFRTEKELKLIQEEINYIKGFSHFNKGIKKGIAKILYWELIEYAGTIIFKKGDLANNWYIILNGCLEAKSSEGKKSILREGDDFGKLSLLNNNNNNKQLLLRQLTVITLQNNCQLLKINSSDFQQIISEIENETIRLKQNNNDVLILQKDKENCGHLLVFGLPEKIIEYILETRTELNFNDNLLEEVILTLPFWIKTNKLCNLLKYYYLNGNNKEEEEENNNNKIIIKKFRTIYFLINWQNLIGDKLFFDPIANSFIEELYSYLLEDYNKHNLIFNNIFEKMNKLMLIRENALLRFSRPPKIILNCGEYINNSNYNNFDSIISSDICKQLILFENSDKKIIQKIQLGQTCSEIIKQIKLEKENKNEEINEINFEKKLYLYELCSDGRKILINENECSIPLIIESESILFLTNEIGQNKINKLIYNNNNKLNNNLKINNNNNSSLILLNIGYERLANALSFFHFKIFFATSEHELIVQIIGRDKFHTRLSPFNLDFLLGRFNQLKLWVITEIICSSNSNQQRLSLINLFIQLIQKLKENKDLFAMAAINFGLSSLPISRLNFLWNQLPEQIYNQYIQLQSFLCPKQGYKNYRFLSNILKPPFVPFIPLMLKELNFLYEGLSDQNLINWEKMQMAEKILKSFKLAKGNNNENNLFELFNEQTIKDEELIYNLNIINKPSLFMKISSEIQKNYEK